ncbi:hypothetical protein [Actinocorallia populi]|uniref:hypothetical protein n=1 Tax=Actinocorallia populi TaxID=2079200 RepID=UPI00130072F5|nr:hypothetical protein [Actinocorallia populi]
MPYLLPDWVAELTDPRRAETMEELADRLVPLAEQAIDVSKRLREQLALLNAPFQAEALHGLIEELNARAAQAFTEVETEIEDTVGDRLARILEHAAGRPLLRERLAAELLPVLERQRRLFGERVGARTAGAVQSAAGTLLDRAGELSEAAGAMVQQVLPAVQEGLVLAERAFRLASRVRRAGRGPVPEGPALEAGELAGVCEETLARLELEWSVIGARSRAVRAALRGVEESAFSEVTQAIAECVAELAPEHARVLDEAEERALELLGKS